MTRAERLFYLTSLFLLRQFAVTAAELSQTLQVSVRTIYRDIASLQRQGVPIEGEAGVGYLLRRGYTLPPLAFSDDERAAIALGLSWAAANGDTALGNASRSALGKIAATVCQSAAELTRDAGVVVPRRLAASPDDRLLICLRRSIRYGRKVHIEYSDAAGTRSDRTIWPVAIGYFATTRLVAAWCELRSDFRHFRTDRVTRWSATNVSFPASGSQLLQRWRAGELAAAGRAEVPQTPDRT